jgi:glucose-1-phosphate thymidylyltransferase
MKFYGLIPAGGMGSRLGKMPCSKEVYPIITKSGITVNTSVVCENLIRYYRLAGITNIHFIIRSGKWDIPAYLEDGRNHGVNISYLMMNLPFGTPFTIDQAYPFVKGDYVALGFPDMICRPEDLFVHLIEKIEHTHADVVLSLFKMPNYQSCDMIEFDGSKINNIVIKEDRRDLTYGWTSAVWGPSFTEFLHEYLGALISGNKQGTIKVNDKTRELYVGDVILAAMLKGYKVEYVLFEEGTALDVGTLTELARFTGSTEI